MTASKFGLGTIFCAGLLFSSLASSDTIGVSAGVSGWYAGNSGTLQAGGNKVNLDDDLGFRDDSFLSVYASLEHPLPAVPNFKFQYFSAEQVELGSINTRFNDVDFDGTVNTNLDLSHYDLILYYEVLDNIVSLDVGLHAKLFDGALDIRQQSDASKRVQVSISEFVPLVYTSAEAALPFAQSLSFGVDASGFAVGDSSIYDLSAKVKFRLVFAGLELGYRTIQADLEDIEGIDVDVDISGPYLSAGLVF